MALQNRFNLIDEPWIPVADAGLVSLKDVFRRDSLRALGGNPVQKIAMTKFLLAIAQAAASPENDDEWAKMGPKGMAERCLSYLEKWHDRFYLFGEQPFLQMEGVRTAALQSFGAVLPEISTGNTSLLFQSQIEKKLSDADKALISIQLSGFGLGGKADNSLVLTPGYGGKRNPKGKPSVSKSGAWVGYKGYLHSFFFGDNLLKTLWVNLFSQSQIGLMSVYPSGVGTPPWELMPKGEDCPVAKCLKLSLMGRLVPLSGFFLFEEDGLHYTEGIAYPDYKEGGVDPSVAIDDSGKDPKALWVDPEKRPWRSITALLGFLAGRASKGFDCWQLRFNLEKASKHLKTVGIWSGGLRISSNSGKVYIGGSDDFVDSLVELPGNLLDQNWFARLSLEIGEMENLSKIVFQTVSNYFKDQRMAESKQAKNAVQLFWQLCEQQFNELVEACESPESAKSLRPIFVRIVEKVYDLNCSRETARQVEAWARNRPNLGSYLSRMKETA